MIKLNSVLKTRPYRSRTSFPRIFILKLEQDMKLHQLHKRLLKNSFLMYALIGTIFINLKINAVSWHTARQTFALLGLFTWLVYARTYCVPIATLSQNKRTRLLYLGDAQMKRKALILHANEKDEHALAKLAFYENHLGWARIKCLLSALTNVHAVSIYQNLSETSMERSIEWRMCSIWHKFHSFMRSSPKFKMVAQISPCLNSLELPVIPCENS